MKQYHEPIQVEVGDDILGQQVATLFDGHMEAGQHTIPFLSDHLASGSYVYRIRAGDVTRYGAMTLKR